MQRYIETMEVGVEEAKAQISRRIDRALDGEDVVITKAGKPLVRLMPVVSSHPQLGTARGSVTFRPGWDHPLSPAKVEDVFGL